MTKDETLKLALEALENHSGNYKLSKTESVLHKNAVDALRQALERQTWVHLLPDEKADIRNSVDYSQFMSAGEYATKVQEATEAKLKELNHD